MKRVTLCISLCIVFLIPRYSFAQVAEAPQKITVPGLSASDHLEIEALSSNKLILKKQKKLLEVKALPKVLVKPSDATPTIADTFFRPAGINLAVPDSRIFQQVVKTEDLDKIHMKEIQLNISSSFCNQGQDMPCVAAVTTYGKSITAVVAAKPSKCKTLQNKVAAITGFNEGNPDMVPRADLATVADYYEQCTTPDLPPNMFKVIGILIDLEHAVGSGESGVVVDGKAYPPIGMALQVTPTRIYTARHVLYRHTGEREFEDPRNIAQLRFIPFSSPQTALRLSRELHPVSALSDQLADVPYDQAVIDLSTAYTPAGVQWPIVQRKEIVADAAPTKLYIAGLQMTLARAKAGNTSGQAVLASGAWTSYIRRDISSTCTRITQTDGRGCMLHGCDTIGGLSGTPIFVNADDAPDSTPVVIGLHRGAAFNNNNVCSAGEFGSPLNVAALPNLTLIKN